MKEIFRLATELQKKRDELDDERDKRLKEIEPLKKFSLRQNADTIRRQARAKMRSRGITDIATQDEVLELLSGLELPDVYEERRAEIMKQYHDSLRLLERGYRPLFQNEVNRLKQAVEKIEVKQESDLLDAKTMQELQLLSLSTDSVSTAVLDRIAEKAKNNETVLKVLDQIAERSTPMDMYGRHLPSHRYRNMLTVERNKKEQAQDALRQLTAGVANYLSYHSDRASRIQQTHYNETHGTQVDSARWKFDDMNSFYHRIEVDGDCMEVLSALEE